MKNAIVWSEIAVSDLKRATAFYATSPPARAR